MKKHCFVAGLLAIALLLFAAPASNAQELANLRRSEVLQISRNAFDTNVRLTVALQMLESKYKVRFVYADKTVEHLQVAGFTLMTKVALDEELNNLLKPLKLTWQLISASQITITPAPAPPKEPNGGAPAIAPVATTPPAPGPDPIKGTIRSATDSLPLPGVTITVKGKKTATASNDAGEFEIQASPGDILVIQSIGYEKKEILISQHAHIHILLKTNTLNMGSVTVIGSRGRPRTDVGRPVPVDLFTAKEIQRTGQVELAQMIHFSAPSFNSTKHGISNVTSYVDPATLRGLGPDQTLVLVNGKRRHQSAALNVNNVVGRGSVGTDLNVIPTGAIDRLEILRDGAAAQYGSDAIAGIINLQLKRSASGGSLAGHYGRTKEGDGTTYEQVLNVGLPLGNKGGFVNATFQFHHNDPTDRSTPFNGRVYNSNVATDDSIIAARKFNRQIEGTKYGTSKNTSGIAFLNAELPLKNDWVIYSFGGYSHKKVTAYGFFRPPSNAKRRVLNIYPNGYAPVFPATLQDISNSTGIRKRSKGGWNMDFSNTFGRNHIALYSNTTVNPSYGDASPTRFFGGNLIFSQNSINADLSKTFGEAGNGPDLTLSFGSELRIERYQIRQGDDASWKKGPLQNTDVGASGREGFADVNAVQRSRTNLGVYVDAESDITEKFLVGAALRFENYSDFGSNVSGKLSARYKLTEAFSIRGSVNRGFRAPSMHQLYYSSNSDAQWLTVNNVFDAYPIGHLRNDNPYVQKLGVGALKAETSLDFNTGLTFNLRNKLLVTVDAYQIDIKDRVVISSQLDATSPQLAPVFNGSGYALVQFFSNALDTRTRGLDVVAHYKEQFGKDQELNLSASLMLNKTSLKGTIRTPDKLKEVGSNMIDRIMLGLIEVAQPRDKFIASVNYRYKQIEAMLRATRFGEVTARQSNPAQDQTFGAKIITDASLTWNITSRLSWSMGANNIGNVYPDKINLVALTSSGQTPYTRFTSQFGFMGAYYYTAIRLGF
jgi:iron complex outermembrane receptor protein